MSAVRCGVNLLEIFEPVYRDLLYRQIAFDGPEGQAVMSALLELQELPSNLGKLLTILSDESSDVSQVTEIVQLNPAIAGKILKVVNSSYAGLRSKVTSLKRAVTLLGFDNLRAIILGMSQFSSSRARSMPPELTLSGLWRHSAAVGRLCGTISNKVGGIDGATLVSAGLLHDIGKLGLAVAFGEKYSYTLSATAKMKGELFEVELRHFGITHPIVAAAMCKYWNLPERLWGLIAAQEHPALAPDGRTAAALKLAEFFARSYDIGSDGQWAHGFISEEICWHLGLSQTEAAKLIEPEEIRRIIRMVGVISKWE